MDLHRSLPSSQISSKLTSEPTTFKVRKKSTMSSTQTDRKFEGWAAMDENSIKGEMKWTEYEPKPFANDDVESESFLF